MPYDAAGRPLCNCALDAFRSLRRLDRHATRHSGKEGSRDRDHSHAVVFLEQPESYVSRVVFDEPASVTFGVFAMPTRRKASAATPPPSSGPTQ